jgi:hypothetical protein
MHTVATAVSPCCNLYSHTTSLACLSVRSPSSFGRVNLLVGKNNVGKSSILEALHILSSRGNPLALLQILTRRGEQVLSDPSSVNRGGQAELDIAHLFYGRGINAGTEFSISSSNRVPARTIKYRIAPANPEESHLFPQMADEGPTGSRLALWTAEAELKIPPMPLSKSGSMCFSRLSTCLNPRLKLGPHNL